MGSLLTTPLERLEEQATTLQELLVECEMEKGQTEAEMAQHDSEMRQLLKEGQEEKAGPVSESYCRSRRQLERWNAHQQRLRALLEEIQEAKNQLSLHEQVQKLNAAMGSVRLPKKGGQAALGQLEKKIALLKEANKQIDQLQKDGPAISEEALQYLKKVQQESNLELRWEGLPVLELGREELFLPAVPTHAIV